MLEDSKDPVVAAACRNHGLVLVTHNYKDFRRIVREFEATNKHIDTLCRIELGCGQVHAAARVKDAIGLIEYEWERLGLEKAHMCIWIGSTIIRTHR